MIIHPLYQPVQEPKFNYSLLKQAADVVGLDLGNVPSGVNPWTWNDTRRASWQAAVRQINPALAQAAEVVWGEPISIALEAALAGENQWSDELDQELSQKRPLQREEMRAELTAQALDKIAATRKAESEAAAARVQSPEQQRVQRVHSLNIAQQQQARSVKFA